MESQYHNGFNIIIEHIYKKLIDLYGRRGIALEENRLSYHNDYDEVNIYYSPPSSTKMKLLCTLDLSKCRKEALTDDIDKMVK